MTVAPRPVCTRKKTAHNVTGSSPINAAIRSVGGSDGTTLANFDFTALPSQPITVGTYTFGTPYTLHVDAVTNCTAAIVNGVGIVVTGSNTGNIDFIAKVKSSNFEEPYKYFGSILNYEFAASMIVPSSSTEMAPSPSKQELELDIRLNHNCHMTVL